MQQHKISFSYVIKRILGAIIKSRKFILVGSILLDTLNASMRISAVFILSLFFTSMRDSESLSLLGFTVNLPPSQISKSVMAAIVISILFALSAVFNYFSVIFARRMARSLNEEILTEVVSGLSVDPQTALKTVHRPISDFNRMLTQNGFHYGMMGESLLRMANPVILFVMACSLIIYLSPTLGFGTLAFSLFFIPVFTKIVSRTRSTAEDFYADQASTMGLGVSSSVLELVTQYGAFSIEDEFARNFPKKSFMANFLDAFDKNILANERMTFAVSLVGALIIFIIILTTGLLFSQGVLDSKSMIALIGAFVFLMTSTRTVASHVTNLIRFFPQVQFICEFVDPLSNLEKLQIARPSSFAEVVEKIENKLGVGKLMHQRIAYYTGHSVSKFTLSPFLDAFDAPSVTIAKHIQFINSSYRFRNGCKLVDMLDPMKRSDIDLIKPIATILGVWDEFKKLPQGLETLMSEQIWNSLSGEARSALRLIPLALEAQPKIILLDIGTISNLNPLTFDQVFSIFTNKVFLIILNDHYCPDGLVENVIVKQSHGLVVISVTDFLSNSLPNPKIVEGYEPFPMASIL